MEPISIVKMLKNKLAKWKCRNSLTKGTSINDLITYAKKGTLP